LNEEEAEKAIRSLVAEGVEAIAICFLWSFRNSRHELRVKELVEKDRAGALRHLLGRDSRRNGANTSA
jgi:N-methylhydantoinase A